MSLWLYYEIRGEITLMQLIHFPWPMYEMQNYKAFVRKGLKGEIHKVLQSQQQSLFLGGCSHLFLQLGKKKKEETGIEVHHWSSKLVGIVAGMEEHYLFVTVWSNSLLPGCSSPNWSSGKTREEVSLKQMVS